MENLKSLARLIRQRNEIEVKITEIIGRPAQLGHIGEYLASKIFDIELVTSASHRRFDGVFRDGPLKDRTVNVKWYAKNEGIIALGEESVPDYYLVMTGPRGSAGPSRGETRPWIIEFVYLFKGPELIRSLREGGAKITPATGVRNKLWETAEIHPQQRNRELALSEEQRKALRLFSS